MPSYRGYRFPPDIISHAVWLYHRFALSFRDVEDVLARRGVDVTYEAIRKWCRRFGPEYAGRLRRRRGRLGDTWHLDEVFVTIQGRQQYLWRAVDEDGDVLDILVQPRRNRHAAVRFFRKLLKTQRHVPRRLITDKLRSYSAACRTVRFCCNFGPATSGWTVFDNDWTGSPIMPSDNPFKWRHFEPGLILLCVRWYLRYAVSDRDLEEMMRERGLCVDHTTIYRWVQRYAPEIDKRCRPFLRRTTDAYRIDETYVRVGGAWHYLDRGVESNGDTLDFLLRATRDRNAAIAFFRKTVGASHTTPPRVVNVDKNPAYPIAFEAIKHEGFFRPRASLRQCKYLNNVLEQDQRVIKRRTRPMLGFKQFTTAWRTVAVSR